MLFDYILRRFKMLDRGENMVVISKSFTKESEYNKQKRAECFQKFPDKMLLNGYTPKSVRGPFVLNDWMASK